MAICDAAMRESQVNFFQERAVPLEVGSTVIAAKQFESKLERSHKTVVEWILMSLWSKAGKVRGHDVRLAGGTTST
jgi:hypothetical protein